MKIKVRKLFYFLKKMEVCELFIIRVTSHQPHTPAVQSPLFMIYFIKKRKEIIPTRLRIDIVGYHQKAIFISIKNAKSGD